MDKGNCVPESLRRFKADIFQALAHPTRIAIIELLGDLVCSVNGTLAGSHAIRIGLIWWGLAILLAILNFTVPIGCFVAKSLPKLDRVTDYGV